MPNSEALWQNLSLYNMVEKFLDPNYVIPDVQNKAASKIYFKHKRF